jgi:hypothetical protein
MHSPNASLTCTKAGQISVVTASIFCGNSATKRAKKCDRVFRCSFNHLPVSEFGDLLDSEQDRNAEAAQVHIISVISKQKGPARLTLVRGGLRLVLPILLSPCRSRHRYSAERLSCGIRRLSLTSESSSEAGAPAIGENDTSSLRVRERGFFGRFCRSDENGRPFHLSTVLRLTP